MDGGNLVPPYIMRHSLNSLKGVIWGIILGTTIGDIKGDTGSLDSSSYASIPKLGIAFWGPMTRITAYWDLYRVPPFL